MTGYKRSTASLVTEDAELDSKALIQAIDDSATSADSELGLLLRKCGSALRRETDKSRRLLDTVETMIVGLNREGYVTLINRRGCELLGYAERELLGRLWFSTCLPEGSDEVYKAFNRIMGGELEGLQYYENEVLTRSGERRLVAWHNNYMRDSQGAIIGTLSAGEDITARRLAEERNVQLLTENRRLTQRLFAVQESERRHIARELHDELGQWLSAVQAHAHLISKIAGDGLPDIRASLDEIQVSVDAIFMSVRRMIRDLRPVTLDTLGLEESLAELVANWESHQSGTSCRLEVPEGLGDLDEPLAMNIYRIIQEALTNVAKHADASRVIIEIRRAAATDAFPPSVIVTVADDGKGTMSGSVQEGMGLLGLRERVLGACGTFELETGPGRGVCIKVRLPVRPEGFAQQMGRDPV